MESKIPGVSITKLVEHADFRGSLFETFRNDEIEVTPQMGYCSYTIPEVVRGPHLHMDQTDIFIFLDGEYHLYLWDWRLPTEQEMIASREVFCVGRSNPVRAVVPFGVVHAYFNSGVSYAYVLNFPNQLYKGRNKESVVDEVRFEGDPRFDFTY